jgi:Flp pilus assembly protein TadB
MTTPSPPPTPLENAFRVAVLAVGAWFLLTNVTEGISAQGINGWGWPTLACASATLASVLIAFDRLSQNVVALLSVVVGAAILAYGLLLAYVMRFESAERGERVMARLLAVLDLVLPIPR